MQDRDLSEGDVREMVAALAARLGGVRALAREIGVSPSYVCDVLSRRRAPGPDFLKAVGVRKEVSVRYVADAGQVTRKESRT